MSFAVAYPPQHPSVAVTLTIDGIWDVEWKLVAHAVDEERQTLLYNNIISLPRADSSFRLKLELGANIRAIFLNVLHKVNQDKLSYWNEYGRAVWHASLKPKYKAPLGKLGTKEKVGTANFEVIGVSERSDLQLLDDGYFVASSKQLAHLREIMRKNKAWFGAKMESQEVTLTPKIEPVDNILNRVHMSEYHNSSKDLVGACFAMVKPYDTESTSTYLEMFRKAEKLLGDSPEAVDVLGAGLQLFASDERIAYVSDYRLNADGSKFFLESWSCNAREDGGGDCEDKAFELMSVANEFQAGEWKRCGNKIDNDFLNKLLKESRKYEFGICLGMMVGGCKKKTAHAFVVGVPKDTSDAYLVLDGVDPRKPRWGDIGGWNNPFFKDTDTKYQYFVTWATAQGEKCFCKDDRYGVQNLDDKVTMTNTFELSLEELAALKSVILAVRPVLRRVAPPRRSS